MTKSQAATVAAALINANYIPTIRLLSDGSYTMEVVSANGDTVNASTLASFATAQGVSALVSTATLS